MDILFFALQICLVVLGILLVLWLANIVLNRLKLSPEVRQIVQVMIAIVVLIIFFGAIWGSGTIHWPIIVTRP